MDIQRLCQSLKMKWLNYYQENRLWLVKMQIWHTYDDLRRPSSGYILATLSVLEPQFQQIIPFILDLNPNPDQIISALGLHFNPDEELCLLNSTDPPSQNQIVSLSSTKKIRAEQSLLQGNHQPADFNDKPLSYPINGESKHILFRITTGVEPVEQPISGITAFNQVNGHSLGKTVVLDQLHHKSGSKQKSWRTIGTEIPKSLLTESSLHPVTQLAESQKSDCAPVKNMSHKLGISIHTNARNLPSWVDEFCSGVGR